MRPLLSTLLAVVIPFVSASAQAQTPDPTRLTGRWSGYGTFFDAKLRKKVDSIPFILQIDADRTGSGAVAGVALRDVEVRSTRHYVEVRAKLERPIAPDAALAKDRLVLVVTAARDSTLEAEFHLKSNFTYDLRMREGRVILARAP